MPRRNSFASRVKAKRAPAAPRSGDAPPRPRRTPSPDETGAAANTQPDAASNIQHPASNIPTEAVGKTAAPKPPKPQAEPDDGFVAVGRVLIHLEVAEDDYGRVIGKGGRIAQSMRALLKVSAVRASEYASLEIGE